MNSESSKLVFRNLKKNELGSVIFGCKHSTMNECLSKQIFGLPQRHYSYIKNIHAGLPLFLFNYSNRKLHGIYEAASNGKLNIDPYCWTSDGYEKTPYPAQVQIRVRLQCHALTEEQFRPVIADNYYSSDHFWFELDHVQTNNMISLLSSSGSAPRRPFIDLTRTSATIFKALRSSDRKQDSYNKRSEAGVGPSTVELPSAQIDAASCSGEERVPFATFSYAQIVGHQKEDLILKKLEDLKKEQQEDKILPSKRSFSESENSGDSMKKAELDDASCSSEESHPWETYSDAQAVEEKNDGLIVKNLNDLALETELQEDCLTENSDDADFFDDQQTKDNHTAGEHMCLEVKDAMDSSTSSHSQDILSQLMDDMKELKLFTTSQSSKICQLEQKLAEAQKEIQKLKSRWTNLESLSDCSDLQADEREMKSMENIQLDPTGSIFLLGGYDGGSWSSALHRYFPEQDVVKAYNSPMNCIHSYAAAAQLDGKIYVFGGGDRNSWYDTAESYDPSDDGWTCCSSLNDKKGSLGGAALHDKIFAIGGGNGVQIFSDVEMLDLDIGRWIRTRSMLEKRFVVATVELSGAIYAVGGYDGSKYLNTAERFDPREHSWTRIATMKARRGCHTVAVLNEKLYAMGGFDGDTMVSTVEVYDPRLGTWTSGAPMNHSRGYSAAAVVNDSIYVIGGLKNADEGISDNVERFNEREGWLDVAGKSVGKRSFFPAISL